MAVQGKKNFLYLLELIIADATKYRIWKQILRMLSLIVFVWYFNRTNFSTSEFPQNSVINQSILWH